MKTKLTLIGTLAAVALTFAVTAPMTSAAPSTKPYPLKECVVSGNELGSMGKVVSKTHEGQEVKFCCKPCVKKFDKAPAKYLAKLK
jgi:hypothetical protein